MRIGAPVWGHTDASSWARLHVERGLGAAYWPLGLEATPAEEAAYLQAAAEVGLVIAEVGVWNNLMDRDLQKREENIQTAIAKLRQADRVGARCCVNITGSLGDRWDAPHPQNLTEETFAQIVRTTQRIIDEASPTRTFYTLESMPWMYPHDIDSMQRLIDAIDRPAFAVHVDMVNLVNGFDKVYHTGAMTQAFFDQFGPLIRSVHAKDVILRDTLTLHIDEAIPGEGIFDFDTLLRATDALGDVPVMSEHLETEAQYAQAVSFLSERAKSLGIKLTAASEPISFS